MEHLCVSIYWFRFQVFSVYSLVSTLTESHCLIERFLFFYFSCSSTISRYCMFGGCKWLRYRGSAKLGRPTTEIRCENRSSGAVCSDSSFVSATSLSYDGQMQSSHAKYASIPSKWSRMGWHWLQVISFNLNFSRTVLFEFRHFCIVLLSAAMVWFTKAEDSMWSERMRRFIMAKVLAYVWSAIGQVNRILFSNWEESWYRLVCADNE